MCCSCAESRNSEVKTERLLRRKAVFVGFWLIVLIDNGIPLLQTVHGVICSFTFLCGSYTARGVLLHTSSLCIVVSPLVLRCVWLKK